MSAASAQAQPGLTARTQRVASAALASSLALAACGGTVPVPSSASPAASRLRSVLSAAWSGYRQVFIQPDGRVVDPKRGGVTTSEGQSYALLRAVWMGDRLTFQTVWRWTASHLEVGGGSPFASLWSNGSIADHDSATDADSDIALALLFAARRSMTRPCMSRRSPFSTPSGRTTSPRSAG
jgi:cellulose synthase (UDP-forming)